MKTQLTRRELLKAAILGTGLCLCGRQIILAQLGQTRDPLPVDPNNPSIRLDLERCRRCGRCQRYCRDETTVFEQTVPPGEDACIHCGQCTIICPAQAITEQFHYQEVARAIAGREKIVIASIAPAIRVSLGEIYGLDTGTNVEGKIVGALKKIGVDDVLDVSFSADLTTVEEASELLRRLEKNGSESPLPMFTSCCPSWVRFVNLFYPDLLPNLSTIKSPVMIQGALVKTYYAQKTGIDPAKIVNVALTPCTAKKAEILLPGMNAAGMLHGNPEMRDVDFALTTRELAYLFNEGETDFLQTQDESYGSLMGTGSGAGIIFGNTGGTMEAVLRTAYKLLNDKYPPDDFFNLTPVRGFDAVREASVLLDQRRLNVAVVHGIKQARPLLESIQNGSQKFDLIEVMACSGGCIGGGGQPVNRNMDATALKQLRLNALYQRDAGEKLRVSCDNPQIRAIYDDFLGEPLSKKSKELLHIY